MSPKHIRDRYSENELEDLNIGWDARARGDREIDEYDTGHKITHQSRYKSSAHRSERKIRRKRGSIGVVEEVIRLPIKSRPISPRPRSGRLVSGHVNSSHVRSARMPMHGCEKRTFSGQTNEDNTSEDSNILGEEEDLPGGDAETAEPEDELKRLPRPDLNNPADGSSTKISDVMQNDRNKTNKQVPLATPTTQPTTDRASNPDEVSVGSIRVESKSHVDKLSDIKSGPDGLDAKTPSIRDQELRDARKGKTNRKTSHDDHSDSDFFHID